LSSSTRSTFRMETKTQIAVFDVDGTLIANNIGITFVRYLDRARAIRPIPKIVVAIGYALYKVKFVGFETAIRLGNFALAGLDISRVATLANECFEKEIRPRIFQDGLNEIKARKQQGYTIILATGAHEAIAAPFGRYVGADVTVCTRSVIANDKYGWQAKGEIPYKTKKRDLVKSAITEIVGQKRLEITVYTDEEKDLALFDIADHFVAVNADTVIRQTAKSHNGRIVEFR